MLQSISDLNYLRFCAKIVLCKKIACRNLPQFFTVKNEFSGLKNLCYFQRKLRSRFIEDRKLARDILCEIAALLGPNYFSYILSVLEGALQRGYQLHILVIFCLNIVFRSSFLFEAQLTHTQSFPFDV